MKVPTLMGLAAGMLTGAAFGQEAANLVNPKPPALESIEVPVMVNSGLVWADPDVQGAQVVFSVEISEPGAPWLRMKFDDVMLSGSIRDQDNAYLIITSHLDGAHQYLNAEHIEQWRHTSAYFNGDTVTIDLVAYPGAGANMLTMSGFTAGVEMFMEESICGAVDDRLPSDDPRAGRAVPIFCSAWLIDDCNNCLITAGHCQTGVDVMEFNVPLSNGNGQAQHPPPEDQYAVDLTSLQGNGGQGVGNDWAYFGCFPNPNTGLTPAEAQGDVYQLAEVQPPDNDQDIRITGYGSGGQQPEWNFAQKTHVGPIVLSQGSTLKYQTDTTGGNSGSPVIDESTGSAIGVHTHGGCNNVGGNHGTGVSNGGWQAALANPKGVCDPVGDCDECVADCNGDGSLDILDFVSFQNAFTAGDEKADVNGDGELTILDFVAYQALFQAGCP